jgi:hypothetical protein
MYLVFGFQLNKSKHWIWIDKYPLKKIGRILGWGLQILINC